MYKIQTLNKIAKCGWTPVKSDLVDAPYFEEAEWVLVCKKLYRDCIKPENFLCKEEDEKWYPTKDHHIVYIAEIIGAYEK